MLFRRLLETKTRASLIASAEGYAVSIVAHAALIGGTLAVTHEAKPSKLAESFSPVAFFIPKDRIQGSRPKQERITFMSAESLGGTGEEEIDDSATRYRKKEVEAGTGLSEMSSVASAPEEVAADQPGDSVMTVLEVDSAAARYDDSAAPPYPPALLAQRVEGTVGIQYIVDTTGHADTSSVVILSATHPDFAASVKNTLPQMRFRAAMMNGRRVRQLVQQLFAFRIDTTMIAAQKKPEKRERP